MLAVLIGDSMVKYMHKHIPGLEIHFVPEAQLREPTPLNVKDNFSAHPELFFYMQIHVQIIWATMVL